MIEDRLLFDTASALFLLLVALLGELWDGPTLSVKGRVDNQCWMSKSICVLYALMLHVHATLGEHPWKEHLSILVAVWPGLSGDP